MREMGSWAGLLWIGLAAGCVEGAAGYCADGQCACEEYDKGFCTDFSITDASGERVEVSERTSEQLERYCIGQPDPDCLARNGLPPNSGPSETCPGLGIHTYTMSPGPGVPTESPCPRETQDDWIGCCEIAEDRGSGSAEEGLRLVYSTCSYLGGLGYGDSPDEAVRIFVQGMRQQCERDGGRWIAGHVYRRFER